MELVELTRAEKLGTSKNFNTQLHGLLPRNILFLNQKDANLIAAFEIYSST
jgi:hypothetical protein